jgi:hypothetical protein
MRLSANVRRNLGFGVHGLIGALLLLAGAGKAFGFAPDDVVREMAGYGLAGQIRLIGFGELMTVLLLLIPRTSSLGVLLASSLWGGIICVHMSHAEDYVMPSCLLLLTWAAAALRDPQIFGSLAGSTRSAAPDRRSATAALPPLAKADR